MPPAVDPAQTLGEAMVVAQESSLELLRKISEGLRGSAAQLAVSNHVAQPVTMADWPVAGSTRLLLPRQAVGGQGGGIMHIPSTSYTAILAHNPNRIGATIVCYGKGGAYLLLQDRPATTVIPQTMGVIGLNGEGGSWDGRLSNLTWCGSVTAIAVEEETTLTVVEV